MQIKVLYSDIEEEGKEYYEYYEIVLFEYEITN